MLEEEPPSDSFGVATEPRPGILQEDSAKEAPIGGCRPGAVTRKMVGASGGFWSPVALRKSLAIRDIVDRFHLDKNSNCNKAAGKAN